MQLLACVCGVCCLVSAASGTDQLLGWLKSRDNLSDYTLLSSHQARSKLSCIGAVSAAVPDAQLVTFSSDTGVCSAFKCALGFIHCRKCRNLNNPNQPVWVRDISCSWVDWTVVQHRVSRSVDFQRSWADYKAGFGEGPLGNFWIGLDSLYSLTNPKPLKLLILMRLWNDSLYWAQYSNFSVSAESDKYRLYTSGFSGSAGIGDAMAYSNGMQFTTMDNDNDNNAYCCAISSYSGWWFNDCFQANMNGLYSTYPIFSIWGISWSLPFGFYYSMKEVAMLIS